MTEWRFRRGWSSGTLRERLERLSGAQRNFSVGDARDDVARNWHAYESDSVLMRQAEPAHFERARVALANYEFSDPSIVRAHFDPTVPLLGRPMLLELKALGFRYLCPAVVSSVRQDAQAFGFAYETVEGHIVRGSERFLLSRSEDGELRVRIEARWQRGDLPNWWSNGGFRLLSGYYQRKWHLRAHARLAWLAHHGSPVRPSVDASGLTHQGVELGASYDRR